MPSRNTLYVPVNPLGATTPNNNAHVEVSIPTPYIPTPTEKANHTYTALPVATIQTTARQTFAGINWDTYFDPGAGRLVAGLIVVNAANYGLGTGEIIVGNMQRYYSTNGQNPPFLFYAPLLHESSRTATGPWGFSNNHQIRGCGAIAEIPAVDPRMGAHRLFSGTHVAQGSSAASFHPCPLNGFYLGPSMPPIGGNQACQILLENSLSNRYPSIFPDEISWWGDFSATSGGPPGSPPRQATNLPMPVAAFEDWRGKVYAYTANKEAFINFGVRGLNEYYYHATGSWQGAAPNRTLGVLEGGVNFTLTDNMHGFVWATASSGWFCDPYKYEVVFFHPDDIAPVVQGTQTPSQPRHYAAMRDSQLSWMWGHPKIENGYTTGIPKVNGATYDAAGKRIFVLEIAYTAATEYQHVVHVLEVDDAAAPPPPPPPPPPAAKFKKRMRKT